jgi:hypothetical protein
MIPHTPPRTPGGRIRPRLGEYQARPASAATPLPSPSGNRTPSGRGGARLSSKAQLADYAGSNVVPLIDPLVQLLLLEQPEDPAAFCAAYFQQLQPAPEPEPEPEPELVPEPPPPAAVGPALFRPATAEGTFVRIITVNDVYKLDNFPRLATAIKEMKAAAAANGCVVKSVINGDFVGPCILTVRSLPPQVAQRRPYSIALPRPLICDYQ